MDSEVQRDGRVLDLTDDAWREDRLPYEDVTIPQLDFVDVRGHSVDHHDNAPVHKACCKVGVEEPEGPALKCFVDERERKFLKSSQSELPEAEQDNGGSTESVKEQEMKWSDLALQSLHENTPSTGT